MFWNSSKHLIFATNPIQDPCLLSFDHLCHSTLPRKGEWEHFPYDLSSTLESTGFHFFAKHLSILLWTLVTWQPPMKRKNVCESALPTSCSPKHSLLHSRKAVPLMNIRMCWINSSGLWAAFPIFGFPLASNACYRSPYQGVVAIWKQFFCIEDFLVLFWWFVNACLLIFQKKKAWQKANVSSEEWRWDVYAKHPIRNP